MAQVHDRWLSDAQHRHSIRMLEDILALTHGSRTSVETLGLAAPGIAVIESDGSIESVDTLRTVEPGASHLGLDVFQHTFDEAAAHPKMRPRAEGAAALADECQSCPLLTTCGGGYLPHRFSATNGYRNPSAYCADLKHLIAHVQRTAQALTIPPPPGTTGSTDGRQDPAR